MPNRNEILIETLRGSVQPLENIPELLKDRDIYDENGYVDTYLMTATLEFMSHLAIVETNVMKALHKMLGIDETPPKSSSKDASGEEWSAEEILKQCYLENNRMKLPLVQFNKKTYAEVKKRIEKAGGRWIGGNVQAFEFPFNADRVFKQLQTSGYCDLAQEFQFFETPADVADLLISIIGEIRKDDRVLEPSAGRGALVRAIHRSCPSVVVDCYEIMPENREILQKNLGIRLKGEDFMTECFDQYSLIIANPPFNKNQDVDHIRKMYELLSVGGRMAAVCSTHWVSSSEKKCTEFRLWLKRVDAKIMDIKVGAFKESGTNIDTKLIYIKKCYSTTLF